ncbi:amino acid adenylation domain-containing protein [Dactylosporangium sp. NPDC051541]|uniref:amino acid adenylation domain-containing protein n=1 Tax=Dactylosporangium sp. NPDC051541 TaxID=3363977 RepID=UPI00378EAE3A
MIDRLELTGAQAGVWYAQQLDPGPAFTTAACVDIDGDVDPARFERALRQVIDEADALRVRIIEGPRQEIGSPDWTLAVVLTAADPDAFTSAALAEPIDLERGPVFAQTLIRRGPGRWTWFQRCHHVVMDAYTFALVAQRLSIVYTALAAGAAPGPSPFGRLADVVAEDIAYRESAKFAADREFWRAHLAGLEVPDLSSGPARPSPAFLRRRVTVSAPSARVEAVLAVVALYVSRLTGSGEVVLGLPMMGRLGSVAARVPVNAVNVLPLRVAVAPADTVSSLVRRVADELRAIRPHQRYRGEDIRRDLGLVGGERRLVGPWVNIKPFGAVLSFAGAPGTPRYLSAGPVDDLSITVDDRGGDELEVVLDANPARYTEARLAAHTDRLAALFTAFAQAPADMFLGRLGLVAAPVVPDTARALPAAGLADLVRGDRDGVAVFTATETVTYGELADRVEALAAVLHARGVAGGSVVAVGLPRTADLLVTLLAVQRTGAAYLPLDLDFPADRLAWMLEDSAPALLITAGARPGAWAAAPAVPMLRLDRALPAAERPCPPLVHRPDDAAYVLYTSGSTGRPKGVVVTRENLVNFLLAMREEIRLAPSDRLVAVTTVSFDISGLELFLPLLSGAAVVLAAKETVQDPEALAALVHRTGATVVQATPTLWRALLEAPGGAAALSGLRVLVGGEALPPDLAARLRKHAAEVTNLYGPTETTIWSTAYRLTDDTVSVGTPIWNTRAYVLDAALRPVPDGYPGELYLGGAGVARGYLNRPGLTASRFVADPYAAGERMYRTGDLAVRRPDGTFDVRGRVDHQVKLRGFRIELGEVEAVLAAAPSVLRAVAVIREDRPGDRRLVAYVVPAGVVSAGAVPGGVVSGGVVDVPALRRAVAEALPDYMVPAAIVVLEALPTTPNGKLDRNALPAAEYVSATAGIVRTAQEELLAGIFADVLGVAEVGPRDDFFALGGHSLLAARVATRARTVFGADLTLPDVFDAPTVAALAARITAATTARVAVAGTVRGPIRPGAAAGEVLSPAQRRLWFLERLAGPSATYNLPLALDLDGPLDVAALRAALHDLVLRHEPLRTIFPDRSGEPAPRLREPSVDLAFASTVDIAAAVRVPFDITVETPLRATLFTHGTDRHVLLLVVHHIAGDEWSLTPMLDDLATAYTARVEGRTPAFAPLPIRYADYAVWQAEQPLDEHLDFWRETLAGAPETLRLPWDRPRTPDVTAAGATIAFPIPAELERGLRALARQHGVTLFMTVQAAVAALLSRLGAGTDIPLGTPVAGRGDDAVERLVGFFVNTVVLRTDVSGDPSFTDLLARVRAADLAALAHQDLPFDRLVEALNPHRSLAYSPLFSVMVSYQARLPAVAGFPAVRVTPRLVETGTAKFDLTFDVAERDGGGLAGSLEFRTDLFDRGTAAAIAARFIRLLAAVTAAPDRPIGAADLLDAAEHEALTGAWQGQRRPIAQRTLPELFAAQVAAHPDAVAIEDGGRTLTYAAVDVLSNRVAHTLIAAGAAPERIVAVRMPRSADQIVALLAVAKSGAAYLPLDITHPPARVEAQLRAADPVLVLTELPALADDDTPPAVHRQPEHAAYIIYTSGSTGRPKGVVVPHAGLAAFVESVRTVFGTGPGTRAAQFVSPAVDVALSELAASILSGGTLVVVPDEARLGPDLGPCIAASRITHVDLPPALLAALPETALPAGLTVTIGGEATPPDVVRRWSRAHRLINAYGPTETTVTATTWIANPGPVLIGRPELNRTAHVLDDRLRPVPPNTPGELYLGGEGLARGYLGAPAQTAERFVADPGNPGRRMYRTGDLVRRTPDGRLEFLGRTDDQVQIRGFRVEPAEVEAVLTSHPAVARAVVVPLGQRLIAYVVVTSTHRGDDLRHWCAARLPEHLVPAAVVELDAIPLTAAGKADKRALPAPDRAADEHAAAGPEPSTPEEATLAALFAELLGRPTVGVDAGFFALGGDSILSIQLVSRARAAGLHIAPRQVFEHQTVVALARVATPATAPAAAPPSAGVVPETPIIAWLRGLHADIDRYSQALLLYTPAGLTHGDVARILRTGLAPHAILAARLETGGDRWQLHVPETPLDPPLRVVPATGQSAYELAALVAAEREAAADRLDPATGAMVRTVWFDRGTEPGRLLLVVHHLVVDGVSWRIIAEDLASAARGERPATVGTPFRAWAAGLSEVSTAPWPDLADATATRLSSLPLDPARDTAATLRSVAVTADPSVAAPLLTSVPDTFRAGVQDVLLAALVLALSRRTGSAAEPLIALEGHGREEALVPGADLVRTVGWFTSEYPVRLPAAAAGPAAVVREVKERLRAIKDGGIGYGLRRYVTGELADDGPEPEILFNYLGRFTAAAGATTAAATAAGAGAIRVEAGRTANAWGIAPELPAAHTTAAPGMPIRHRLAINASTLDSADGPVLRAEFTYPAAALADADARRIADDWFAALVAISAAVHEPGAGALTPSDVPLAGVDRADLAELTAAWPGLVDVLPLSPLQEGLLYLAGTDDSRDVYTVQQIYTLTGDVDPARLRSAAAALLDRYPNLRGGFTRTASGRAVQVIPATAEVPFTELDLTASADPEAALADLAAAERIRPFDLAAPPLLRFVLARFAADGYRLLLTQHHLLMDGWSGPLAMRDLFARYAGRSTPSPRPYRDYLTWLAAQDRGTAERAWRAALAGLDEPTLVAPGAPAASVLPQVAEILLPSEPIAETARAHGLTLNTLVQGAWALTLVELTGRTDVVFGATVAGRPAGLPGVDDMVGLFINTIPVRARPRPGDTWAGFLARLQSEQAELLDHQYLGLADLQRLAGVGELFDTLTVFESYPTAAATADVPGLRIGGGIPVDATHYPLSLVVVPGEQLRLRLEHRPDVYPPAEAEHILTRFAELLQTAPATLLSRVSTVDQVWYDTAMPVPAGTVLDEFAATVSRTPDAIALCFIAEQLTFAELDARVTRLARVLVEHGAVPDRPVAVLLPRSVDAVVAWLAVMRAGGIYLPIDADYPAERIDYILEDARPAVVVTLDLLAKAAGPGVELPVMHPRSGAYLIYTSGSTGRPKGVVVEHNSLMNLFHHHREHVMPQQRIRAGLSAATVFDTSWEGVLFLVAGHELHVLDDETRRDPDLFVSYVREHSLDFLDVTPSLAGPLVSSGLLQHPPKLVALGGEAADPGIWTALREATIAINLYGPTECTVDTLMARINDTETPSVGRPIANTRAYILDSWLRPAKQGELYLAGAQLGRGYLNQPGLTSARFVADPFVAGERMYRTGDVVRLAADGSLEFVGRADEQVKIRGFRVEPGEVAAVLAEHPDVAQAVVVAVDGRLVAYVVGSAGELRAWAGSRLPEYLVPAAFVELERIPVTVAGKVDKRALPAPDFTAIAGAGVPRSPAEEILAGLFAEVLGLAGVGTGDDFFALGGHSLTATALAARVRAVFGAALPVRAVFDAPTVAALAARLELFQGGDGGPVLIGGAERPEHLPVSPAQHRLWLHHQLNGAGPTYNVAFALRLTGALDADALRLALVDVLDRHESLRTVFPSVDGRAVQRVLPAVHPEWHVIACTEAELPGRLADAARHGFDLTAEPLIRPHLFAVGTHSNVLLLLLHHIVTDEWSEGRIVADLGTAYAARTRDRAPDWAPLPVQYADYALWQRELLGDADDPASLQARQLAFWREALAGAPTELTLPTDRPRPAQPSHAGGIVPFDVPADTHRRVRELARRTGATAFMVVQAALAALLHRLGAGTDIPLGSPVAGRADQRLDELAGFFVNTLVLRADLTGDPTFAELVARVRAADLAAFGHADVPFDRVVEALNPERSLARNPLFQVMVAFQHVPAALPGLPGLVTEPVPIDTGVAQFDLGVVVTEHDGEDGLRGVIEYSADLFDRATVTALADRLVRLVTAAVTVPNGRVSDLDVLTAAERRAIATDWQGPVAGTAAATLPQLFAEQVARRPGAVAIEDGPLSLTYAELDARTDRLARRLARLGAGPERIVMVLLPRSADLFVAELAVAKAGAAYLPVDPSYPAERVALLAADASPVLVIAHADAPTLPAGVPHVSPVEAHVETAPAGTAGVETAGVGTAGVGTALTPPTPWNAAYVIYTSGSTGRPKGVVIPHAGLADLAGTFAELWKAGPGSRIAQFASPSFDVTVAELAISLLRGGTLVIVPEEHRLGTAFAEYVRDHGVTHFALPPAALAALPDGVLPRDVTVVTGADRCPPDLVTRWTATHRMLNAYGPTEATVNSTYWVCEPGSPVLIGRPDRNKRAHILDAGLRPVPPGVPGELYLAGAGLARGYLNRSALTAERFVADPYGPPGTVMYRTGDLARWNSSGLIEFLGRTDDQVKIRGFRIEPGEVEAALAEHPAVRQVVVIARDSRLIAYVVAAAAGADLREWAAARLPDHLVPAAFVELDRIPVTIAGKVDRKALPEPVLERRTARPATVGQELFATLFAELLGLDEVGADEGFFALGGDSIVALQLVARARAAGLELSPRQVFEHQTVAALAAVAVPSTVDTPTGRPAREPAAAAYGDVPLTPIVAWLSGLDAPIDTFAQAIVLRVPAELTHDGLTAILRAVVDRHDALRARWTGTGLVIPPPGNHVIDLRFANTSLGREHTAAVRRLDPAGGRMLQAVWYPSQRRLLLVAHHLVVDGVSWRIIAGDLATAWAQVARGERPELPPAGTSFRTWARGLTSVEPDRSYWLSTADPAVAPIGQRSPDPAVAAIGRRPLDPAVDNVGAQRELMLRWPADETRPLLTTVPDAFHAGVQDVLLAGLALAVRQWRPATAASGLLLRLEGHGREEQLVPGSDLSRTVGWFTVEYPVRLHTGGDDPAAALKHVKEQLRAVPGGGTGYGLLRYLNPDTAAELAARPGPEILFNYLGRLTSGSGDDGPDWVAAAESDELGDGLDPAFPAGHALEINAATLDRPTGPELDVRFTYVGGVLDAADVARLGELWRTALTGLRAAADDGGFSPSDLSLVTLSQGEIDEFEDEWRLL